MTRVLGTARLTVDSKTHSYYCMHISVCTVVCSESFDVLASLGEMQVENQQLLEKVKQLEDNLEQTEEQLRTLQTENSSLLSQQHRSGEHLLYNLIFTVKM